MKGRKPKPDATRRRRNARPSLPQDLARAAAIDGPPKWITGEARTEWKRVVGELQAEGAATNWDRALLIDYCRQFEKWQHAEQQIKKHGYTQVGFGGVEIPSVWMGISNGAHDRMLKLAEKLRLTPVDRARTPIAKPKTPTTAAPARQVGAKVAGEDPRRLLQMVPKR